MTLEQLRAALRTKHGALAPLREKILADDAQDSDIEALDVAIKDVESVQRRIEAAERAEAIEASGSLPATQPIRSLSEVTVEPKVAKVEEILSLTAAAIVVAKSRNESPFKVLEDEGYSRLSHLLLAGQPLAPGQKAVNTLVPADGGVLVPAAQVGSIVPLLRIESTFLDAGPTRVPLTNGQYKVGRGATGATASYIAEGALKPVSTPTFDAISMASKKLAGIVPITNEAKKWTIGDIEGYVRADLRSALALTMDLNAYLGTGAGASPTGILNKVGVQTYTPTVASPGAPTIAELDKIATGMILLFTTNRIYAGPGRWRWLMSRRTAMAIADKRVGTNDGEVAYPSMQGAGTSGTAVTWKGIPVTITDQFPTNGGATTDETTLALVDFNHVLFGEEEGITMKMSDQATLDLTGAGTTFLHLWQMNMFAILAESMHDFGLRFVKAVVKATIRF